ncbi:apovitellenin-1-like [Sphaerodactylus townsendi]|uniref:apovitellenin-1-like n=1 Tax=Sphaerodactylus townsendi TaxID=933632 RepID=UPI0020264E61|nr:apovitellenin-1-like [Sphaerodactylus townsendi]
MFQSKAAAVCLILLLGCALTEVGAKAISKRHVRRDWMIVPDAIAFYVYKAVEKMSPKTAELLAEAVQTPFILDTRNYLIKATAQIQETLVKMTEKVSGFWQQQKDPAQQ